MIDTDAAALPHIGSHLGGENLLWISVARNEFLITMRDLSVGVLSKFKLSTGSCRKMLPAGLLWIMLKPIAPKEFPLPLATLSNESHVFSSVRSMKLWDVGAALALLSIGAEGLPVVKYFAIPLVLVRPPRRTIGEDAFASLLMKCDKLSNLKSLRLGLAVSSTAEEDVNMCVGLVWRVRRPIGLEWNTELK